MVEHLIDHWHKRMLGGIEPLQLAPGTGIVMGCPLWGTGYIDQFLAYGLPSIRAPRNRAALERAGWELVIFVDGEAEARLAATGIPMRLVRIPEDIMVGVREQTNMKYPLLTAVHNLLIHKARDIDMAGFHMMVADSVYSERYFERLLEMAVRMDAIAHTGIVADSGTALPALDAYRQNGTLTISARELGWLGWDHFAPQWKSWNMDGITEFEEMPTSHFVHVRGRNVLRIHCAHQNVAWISNDRCRKVEAALGGTLDSELPRYIAGGFHIPTLDDDMTLLVLAGSQEPVPRSPWEAYKREFWAFIGGKPEHGNNPFLPYFVNPVRVLVPFDPTAPDEVELDARLGRLMEKLNA